MNEEMQKKKKNEIFRLTSINSQFFVITSFERLIVILIIFT